MLTYEIAAMLCIATFALGMGMGVFAVDMMRRAQSLPMHEPIEHDTDNYPYARKSDVVRDLAKKHGYKVVELPMPNEDPADYVGYTMPKNRG